MKNTKRRPTLRLVTPPAPVEGEFVRLPTPRGARSTDRIIAADVEDFDLTDAGIYPDDTTVSLATTDVRSGELAIIEVDELVRIGRYYPAPGGYIRLETDSGATAFRPERAKLLGRVVGILRDGAYTAHRFRPIRKEIN